MKMENFIITHHEISKKCKKVQKKLLGVGLEPWPVDCKKSHVFKGYVKNTYVKRKHFFLHKS